MNKFNVDRYLADSDAELYYTLEQIDEDTALLWISEEPETMDGEGEEFDSFSAVVHALKAMRPAIVEVTFNDDYDYRDEVVKIVIRQVREYGKVYGFKVCVEE